MKYCKLLLVISIIIMYSPSCQSTDPKKAEREIEVEKKLLSVWGKEKQKYKNIAEIKESEFTSPEEYKTFMTVINKHKCSCGCKMTLAHCRTADPGCKFSKPKVTAIAETIRNKERLLSHLRFAEIDVKKIDVGGRFILGEEMGKVVVISLWATWCGPCRQEVKHLNVLQEKYGNRISILALNAEKETDVSDSKVREVANAWGMKYPVARASEMLVADLNISGFPTTFILDPIGIQSKSILGVESERSLSDAIDKAFAETKGIFN